MMYKEVVVNSPLNGAPVKAFEVPARDSTERWSEVTLDDGTVMRIKVAVISAARIEGQWDKDGNPLYVLKAAPMMDLVNVPGDLKRRQ
jgi:hypothetical protein